MIWKLTKLSKLINPNDPHIILYMEISEIDMIDAPLDEFDHIFIDECNKSELLSDKLLMLETIARRIESKNVKSEDIAKEEV